MLDQYNREIDYVRISLTDRCNLRCVYCMPEEGVSPVGHEKILSFEEIMQITGCLASLGIKKVKLTGGEPLLRKDCSVLVKALKNIPGIEKVSLTTNGVLLKEELHKLVEAGLDAVNVSLDTLDEAQFEKITRRNLLKEVLEGLEAAAGISNLTVKINCVPMRQPDDTLAALAGIAKNSPVHVRFIEMMPIGCGRTFPFRGEADVCAVLEAAHGTMKPISDRLGNGPCHYYEIEGFQGKIGFISAMTHKFCSECNRVRLTSEGYLKSCLQYQNGINLRDLLRGGASDTELTAAIRKVIWNKPASHQFEQKSVTILEERMMSQIGG